MERLTISDPEIEEQLQFRLAQLNEFYPDKVITRLDADHKKLGEKLSALYKQIGYASRGDLLSAYGFTIGSKQGRPSSVDSTEIFIELRKRYADKELPKTASILMEQNPDLAGQLKTLSNQSKELFGDTFKNVLIEEGLLQGKAKARGGANREPVQAMLDELVEIYGNGNAMYKSVTALKKAHPEFADEFDALQAHSKEWYGTTPVKLLKKLGVLGAGIVDQTAEDIDTLIEFLVSKYSNLPDDEKPKIFASLKTSWPDKEAALIAGQHEWGKSHNESFVDTLRRRGVLQVSKKSIAEETKRLKTRSVRNATIDELVDVLGQSGCPSVLEFDENRSVLLPERVLGIDLTNRVELRESVFCGIVQNADDLQVGDPVKPQTKGHRLSFKNRSNHVIFGRSFPEGSEQFKEIVGCDESRRSSTRLKEHAGSRVVAISICPDGRRFAQIRLAYLYNLTSQTLLNLMCSNGLLSEEDLLVGDSWRERDFAGTWRSKSASN